MTAYLVNRQKISCKKKNVTIIFIVLQSSRLILICHPLFQWHSHLLILVHLFSWKWFKTANLKGQDAKKRSCLNLKRILDIFCSYFSCLGLVLVWMLSSLDHVLVSGGAVSLTRTRRLPVCAKPWPVITGFRLKNAPLPFTAQRTDSLCRWPQCSSETLFLSVCLFAFPRPADPTGCPRATAVWCQNRRVGETRFAVSSLYA